MFAVYLIIRTLSVQDLHVHHFQHLHLHWHLLEHYLHRYRILQHIHLKLNYYNEVYYDQFYLELTISNLFKNFHLDYLRLHLLIRHVHRLIRQFHRLILLVHHIHCLSFLHHPNFLRVHCLSLHYVHVHHLDFLHVHLLNLQIQ